MTSYMRWFRDVRLADRPSVGGKTASLNPDALRRADFPVPSR